MIIKRFFCQFIRLKNPETIAAKAVLKQIDIPDYISLQRLSMELGTQQEDLQKLFNLIYPEKLDFNNLSQKIVEPILTMCESAPKWHPQKRPPIITIMGHVDHGKTTLLDNLRNSQIAEGEYGGITQKLGAFHVQTQWGQVTVIDTPGHQAFSNMRLRGAQFTDIIILVVSAIEGIQPQTKEVIDIAKKFQIPIIVAINKIDVMGADPEEIEVELSNYLELESFGGNVPVIHISALTGKNVDLLLELINFQADLLKLTADPNINAQGIILEARQQQIEEQGSTLLILQGTLKVGDLVIVGQQSGRVKIIRDDRGQSLTYAGPSCAVEIIGLKTIPQAGEKFFVVSNEKMAKLILQQRIIEKEKKTYEEETLIDGSQAKIHLSNRREKFKTYGNKKILESKYEEAQEAIKSEMENCEDPERVEILAELLNKHRNFTEQMVSSEENQSFNLILKGQDFSTLETVQEQVQNIIKETQRTNVTIINASVGDITLGDLKNAHLFEAQIFTLNSEVPVELEKTMRSMKIKINHHKLIYNLIDDIKGQILEGKNSQKINASGEAKVLNIFEIKTKTSTRKVYGIKVTNGTIEKKNKIRVLRGGQIIVQDIEIINLKHFKDEVTEAGRGKECGICFIGTYDIQTGDTLECYKK